MTQPIVRDPIYRQRAFDANAIRKRAFCTTRMTDQALVLHSCNEIVARYPGDYELDTEALPIRARARVLGATLPKGGSHSYPPLPAPTRLSRRRPGSDRGERRTHGRARRGRRSECLGHFPGGPARCGSPIGGRAGVDLRRHTANSQCDDELDRRPPTLWARLCARLSPPVRRLPDDLAESSTRSRVRLAFGRSAVDPSIGPRTRISRPDQIGVSNVHRGPARVTCRDASVPASTNFPPRLPAARHVKFACIGRNDQSALCVPYQRHRQGAWMWDNGQRSLNPRASSIVLPGCL
jgi:hypothetical protein